MADIYPISGAAEWINDSSEHYLYFASGTYLYRKPLPGASDWSDVESFGSLEDVDWHTMKVADGALMICNGSMLAMVGWDESYTTEAVVVYPDELTKTIIERQNLVVIGTYKNNSSEKGALYTWEQSALNFIQRKEIPSGAINGIVDTELTLMQAGDKGGIFYSDLINSVAITAIPGEGEVNPGGVDVDDGLGLFGMFGGDNPGVYSLGRNRKNAPFVLNLDYPLDCDEIGAVCLTY
jgi:hypothetical protein